MSLEKLDNPAWYALQESHKEFALDYGGIQFYHPDYCPFGGFMDKEATQKGIDAYAALMHDFYVIGDKPDFSEKLILKRELICYQLLLEKQAPVDIIEPITDILAEEQRADLSQLIHEMFPGFFQSKTAGLGSYYGIYKNHQLVAAAGERMKMNGYTEISAVVTHPDYAGRGYASQLIARTANHIFEEGKIPYLHVTDSNSVAIRLYNRLGFKMRRKMSFWNFVTSDGNE